MMICCYYEYIFIIYIMFNVYYEAFSLVLNIEEQTQ